MPTTSRQRRQASLAPDLDQLHEQVALLLDEQEQLPAAIADAMSDTDVESWLRLTVRQRDLPGLIQQARVPLVRAELQVAWDRALAALATEDQAAATHRTAAAALDEALLMAGLRIARDSVEAIRAPRSLTPTESADRRHAADLARAAADDADRRHRLARHDSFTALYEVDRLSAQLEQLTGQPVEDDDRPLRQRRLLVSVVVGEEQFGETGVHLRELTGGEPYGAHALPAGQVLPRWVTHAIAPQHLTDAEDGDAR